MKLTEVTEEQVQWAVGRLNHRPCKVLGFKIPHEIFFGVSVSYTHQPSEVAIRIWIHDKKILLLAVIFYSFIADIMPHLTSFKINFACDVVSTIMSQFNIFT